MGVAAAAGAAAEALAAVALPRAETREKSKGFRALVACLLCRSLGRHGKSSDGKFSLFFFLLVRSPFLLVALVGNIHLGLLFQAIKLPLARAAKYCVSRTRLHRLDSTRLPSLKLPLSFLLSPYLSLVRRLFLSIYFFLSAASLCCL